MAKIQPAQKVLYYVVTPSSGAFDVSIDLAKDLSATNRRLYRQGMQYLVANVKVATGKGLVVTACCTAGDTWMVHNAWKKGFNMWKKQRADIQEQLPGLSGKWADFKVELWDGSTTLLNPLIGGDTLEPDEWEMSEVFWEDDGTEYSPSFCLVGSSNANPPTTKASLVQEYHISRSIPQAQEPRVSAEAAHGIYALVNTDMEGDLSEDLIDDISGDNDACPYDADEMVGGDSIADEPLTQSIGFASEFNPSNSGPFTAECGLLRIIGTSKLTSTFPHQTDPTGAPNVYDDIHYLSENLDDAIIVQVTLAPGPYRGVMATPMGQ